MASEAGFWYWGKAFLSLLIIHLSCTIIYRKFFSPLSKFPGPFWGSITDLYSFYINLSGEQHLVQYELHKKYGPIVRYRPNLLIVSDPKMLPVIYHRYADKTNFYAPIIGEKTAFTTLKHHDHVISRKRIIGPYNIGFVNQLEAKVDTSLREWTDKLRREISENGKSRDFNQKIIWLGYDMVADLIFGKPLGFVASNSDVNGMVEGANLTAVFHSTISLVPGFIWMLRNTFLGHLFLPKRSNDFGYGFLMAEAKRLAIPDPGNWNFLHMFLEVKDPDGTSMTMEQLASEARLLLIGGARPTASITTDFFLNILGNPACYDKLAVEVSEAESHGQLSHPIASFDEAHSLPYFTACLKETLRGGESTTTMIPRMAAIGGAQVLGQFVPEGTHLSAIPWITNRNRTMYGEDAELFRPERWLEASPEKIQQWNKYEFEFGYGTRACPGKRIALMIIYKLCLQILRTFEIRKLNEDCPLGNCFTHHIDDKRVRDQGLFIKGLRERGTAKA